MVLLDANHVFNAFVEYRFLKAERRIMTDEHEAVRAVIARSKVASLPHPSCVLARTLCSRHEDFSFDIGAPIKSVQAPVHGTALSTRATCENVRKMHNCTLLIH